jgi:uncharacterized protein (DUF58 family)
MAMAQETRRPPTLAPATVTARARAAGHWPGAFGPRFFVALILGLLWIGPAWWDLRFLFALAGWDALVMLAWFKDWTHLPQPDQLEVSRIWRKPLAQAEPSEITLQIRCAIESRLQLSLEEDLPPPLVDAPMSRKGLPGRESPKHSDPRLASLAGVPQMECSLGPGGMAEATYSVFPTERGDFQVGGTYLRYQGPLKLAERWCFADLKQRVRVYPSLGEAKQHTFYLMRSRQIELEKRLKRQRGAGREFENLRDYREGDELRDICWTATARRGKLITKVHCMERSQTVLIVIDAGRLMMARVKPVSEGHAKTGSSRAAATLTKLDYAIRASLGIAQVALYSGDTVGLLAYGRKRQHSLSPGRGTPHLRAMLESLASVRGELAEADHARAADRLLKKQRRRSLVIWLTDLAETPDTPEVIESATRLLRQHLVLFVAVTQPELAEMAARRPGSEDEMYRYVAAQEMIQRRDLLRRRLSRQGALAIELEPGKLAAGLINHYLEVKERGLL